MLGWGQIHGQSFQLYNIVFHNVIKWHDNGIITRSVCLKDTDTLTEPTETDWALIFHYKMNALI